LSTYFKTTNSDGKYDDLPDVLASIIPDGIAADIKLSTGYNHYSGCNVLMLISLSVCQSS